VDALIIKTAQYGQPKTQKHCTEMLSISQRLVFAAQCLKSICGPNFLQGRLTAKSFQNLLTQLTALLEENKQDCWFSMMRRPPIVQKPQLTCRTSPVIT
jgi:hypothetical protein